jgi:CubicO group peptidase (beta-lactamase class C family)
MKFSATALQAYVGALVDERRVPALSIALWQRGKLYTAAAGVLNVERAVPASTDTLFMIGSISKSFTASLIMLLVDEGRLDLDVPIRHYLRDFHVASPEAVRTITARHLLSHTSGLETDIYPDDLWEQGNPIARYLDRCFLLPQVHEQFGKRFSYSNVGYVAAGRVVEVLTGMPWAQAIDERIYAPLGMRTSVSSSLQTPSYSMAMGHMYDPAGGGGWRKAADCYRPRGNAPAGSALAMSAADLVKFGRAHLNGGRSETGQAWLSGKSVKAMQAMQIELPGATSLFENGWGVGWSLSNYDSVMSFGHGGGRRGYQALLQIVPEHDLVLGITANGMALGGGPLVRRVLADVISEVVGVQLGKPAPLAPAGDLRRFVGTYGASQFKIRVENAGDRLHAELGIGDLEKARVELRPLGGERFAVYSPVGEHWEDGVAFMDADEQGHPKYLFFAHRLNARVKN